MTSAMLRIFEIIIFCLLTVSLEGKSLKTLEKNASGEQTTTDRIKRGFAHHGGNGKLNNYLYQKLNKKSFIFCF